MSDLEISKSGMEAPADHPPILKPRIGVLLINLGTPAAPTTKAVRDYLGEFLSDKRVVEIPAIVWQPLLRGVILNTRPQKSAAAYAEVWTDQGSPLAVYSKRQAEALKGRLGDAALFDFAMRWQSVDRIAADRDEGGRL